MPLLLHPHLGEGAPVVEPYGMLWNVPYHSPGNRCETQISFKMKILSDHLERSGMFSTEIQAIFARVRHHLKGILLEIIGRT